MPENITLTVVETVGIIKRDNLWGLLCTRCYSKRVTQRRVWVYEDINVVMGSKKSFS